MNLKNSEGKEFNFSIIMPIYNADLYLDQAINSVINQTIDFEENIQLILIDDGSTDESKNLCAMYQRKYPNNIIFKSQNHCGVSSARNLGLQFVSGKYVSFLDSDDYFSENTLEEVFSFFEKNRYIDMVTIPMAYFDKRTGGSELNFKFSENSIVNLEYFPDCPILNLPSSFFKYDEIFDLSFDESNDYYDIFYIAQILLNNHTLGLLDSATYYYRKSHNYDSLTDGWNYDNYYYTRGMFNFFNEFIDSIMSKNDCIPNFIQYMLLYLLDDYLKDNLVFKFLNESEMGIFVNNLKYVLNYIDDENIFNAKYIKESVLTFLIYIKHVFKNDGKCNIDNLDEYFIENINFNIEDIQLINNSLLIMGSINSPINLSAVVTTDNDVSTFQSSSSNLEYGQHIEDFLILPHEYIDKHVEINIPVFNKDSSLDFEIKHNNIKYNINSRISFGDSLKNLDNEIHRGNYLISYNDFPFTISYLFNFSIIMAMYNVEDYLEEAVDSLINQTLDFEDNVQLLLIDDGSPDNSKEIALEYAKKYPNNIFVLSKENGGQSSAFNLGLEHIKGRYVNFLDSDDYLSENTLEEVLNFYNEHESEVDVVAIPLMYFERMTGNHRFNYRFKTTRVIDLIKEPKNPQYSVANAFIKYEAIKHIKFDTRLYNGYDATVINKIIFDKKKYGVLSNCAYYYRQRSNASSIMDNQKMNKRVFTEKIKYYYLALVNHCMVKEGKVPFYLQYALANDLQGILAIPDLDVFDNEREVKEFWFYLDKIISYIDYNAFVRNDHILRNSLKPFFAFLKFNKEFNIELQDTSLNKDIPHLKTRTYLIDRLDNHWIWLEIVEVRDGFLNMSGIYGTNFFNESISIYVNDEINNERYKCDFVEYKHPNHSNVKYLSNDWLCRYTFDVSIPIKDIMDTTLFFEIEFHEKEVFSSFAPQIGLSTRSGLSKQSSYFTNENIIVHVTGNKFNIMRYSFSKMFKLEYHTIKNIYHNKEKGYKNAVFIRSIYLLLYLFMKNKEIWLFSDRRIFADDNGTYLFRYACNQKDNVKKYFVIDKNSNDYKNMKKISRNVIPYGSLKHKILYLFSSKTISAFANEDYYDPFFDDNLKLYEGLITRRKYFLQHGVTIGNQSGVLNKARQNFSLILSAAHLEYESFINEAYNYDENVIQLLGFPRHDYLENNNSKKQIVYMPTWRISFNNDEDLFVKSEYYEKLHHFLNNEKLHDLLDQYDYELVFRPHPELFKFMHLMNISDKVRLSVDVENESYHDLFNESSLLITDYSSVFFDFAYLKKPIIYYQFDEYHYDKGYFDFETMGFGEIFSEEHEVIDKIKEYLENDFSMNQKFIDRVDKFFKFNDKNNSKRVYDWIKKH